MSDLVPEFTSTTILVEERFGQNRCREPLRLALPLKPGAARAVEEIVVRDTDGNQIPVHRSSILGRWRDATISWALLETVIDIDAFGTRVWSATAEASASQDTKNHDKTAARSIDDDQVIKLLIIDGRTGEEEALDVSLELTHGDGTVEPLRLLAATERPGDVTGRWARLTGSPIGRPELIVALDVATDSEAASVECEVFLHNTAAASHPGGLWDLGDPASFELNALVLTFKPTSAVSEWTLSDDSLRNPSEETLRIKRQLDISQLSSGGSARRSPVHVNRHGEVTVSDFGYRMTVDDAPAEHGERISPRVSALTRRGRIEWTVPRFWQEFPSGLRIAGDRLEISLPASGAEPIELQPGERKRRRVTLCLRKNDNPYCLYGEGIVARVGEGGPVGWRQRWYQNRQATESLSELSEHLVGPDEYIAKRERIDEYGWRNFGDVFADHENLYREPGEPLLVSHYNNQYDLAFGFGMLYLRDGDSRWLELMNDLVRHVVDVDLYTTDLDRIEFNGGLFWHTSHYADAGTATHRTYSINAYDPTSPIGSSGGPSPEHCYTSGLALHHYLTGDPASREAVLSLARWIRGCYEGDASLSGRVFAAAQTLRGKLRGGERGMLPGAGYLYPLNRATANLIDACLDARALEMGKDWASYLEYVLQKTFGKDDDIEARAFDDIEANWSYTVFLQAVLRYLVDKEAVGECDAAYLRNRDAWCHYLLWMVENESPYRDAEDSLEFANVTWSAQDLRKVVLLSAAPRYLPELRDRFCTASSRLVERTHLDLSSSPESHHTRIQAILLQSIGSYGTAEGMSAYTARDDSSSIRALAYRPVGVASSVVNAFTCSGFKRELHWWRTRLPRR